MTNARRRSWRVCGALAALAVSGLALAATTHDQARATSGHRSAAATAHTAAQPSLRRLAQRLLREHIHRVVGHFRRRYPGLVRDWDVVNEAVDNDGTLRRTIWQRWIGNDYIDWAFRFTREAAGPRARLFYNDYLEGAMPAASEAIGGEFDNYDPHPYAYPGATGRQACSEVVKCRAIMRLVERLRRCGVPIDGVGFQGHLLGGNPPDYVGLTRWVRKLGLRWAITELDLPLPAGASANDRERQGAAFAQAVKACRRDPACDTVVFWGLSDRYTWWRDLTRGALVDATLFDPLLHPKPAYWAVARALR